MEEKSQNQSNPIELSAEDADLIFKGVRPEGMNFVIFKYYRKLANDWLKKRKRGYLFHESIKIEEIDKEKFKRISNTYVKSKENAKI